MSNSFDPRIWQPEMLKEFYGRSLFMAMYPKGRPPNRREKIMYRIREIGRRIRDAWLVLTGKAEIEGEW